VIGLGQAETADPFAGREFRQILLPLFLGAEIVNRVHDEARLHAHRRAVAAIDPLDLARDQPVGDIIRAGAAVALDRRAEKAQFAHLVHDLAIETLLAVRGQDAREQLFLAVGAGAVAHQALVLAEFLLEQQRVGPVEFGGLGEGGRFFFFGAGHR
jgi:hypothetical protein